MHATVFRSSCRPTTAALALLALGGALPLASPADLAAQAVLGIGDDALVLPRGVFRVRAIGQTVGFDQRYGVNSTTGRAPGELEPLLADLNIPSIGTQQFPSLAPVEQGLRALTGNTAYDLSLGRTTATGGARIDAGSTVLELGLTDRLSMGVVLPYVRTRNEVNLRVNPNGEGNVGFNPAALPGSAARTANTQLVGQLLGAARTVEASVGLPAGGCGTSALPQCQLVNGTRTFAGGVGTIYGADAVAGFAGANGSPLVPITGNREQLALATRVQQLRAAFGPAGAGITAAGPTGAASNLDLAGAQRILSEPGFGVIADQVGTTVRTGLGDVEVAAKYLLLDSFGGRGANARLDPTGINVRSALTGVVRVGTGRAENPQNFVDVPTGTGAHGLGVRSATDVLVGRRFFGTFAFRYLAQIADDQFVRVIDAPERVLAPAYRFQRVRRDLGDIVEMEATPRVVLTDWLLVAGQYTYRNKAEDRWRGTFTLSPATTGLAAPLEIDARNLNAETLQREQRIGAGLSLSSVKAFTRGRAPLPAELTYSWQQTIDGYGGTVPRLTLHQVQVRLYARAFGG